MNNPHLIAHSGLLSLSKILGVGTGQGIMAVSLALNGYDVLTGEPEEGSEVVEAIDIVGAA